MRLATNILMALSTLFLSVADIHAETQLLERKGSTQIVGWAEKVRVYPEDLLIDAKIDTGADHSSLHAPDFTIFERDGDRWVRFTVTDSKGKTVTLERKVVRLARIKRHSGPRQERPVVKLRICLGNNYDEAEVNLVDRSRFKYPMLIGRSYLQHGTIVDASSTYITQPNCPGAKAIE